MIGIREVRQRPEAAKAKTIDDAVASLLGKARQYL
jgi:hypothetical protein